jgi:hypothetical protein
LSSSYIGLDSLSLYPLLPLLLVVVNTGEYIFIGGQERPKSLLDQKGGKGSGKCALRR